MSRETLAADLVFEVGEIDALLSAYGDLIRKIEAQEPDLVEISATATLLHAFYTGVENMLSAIAKRSDGKVPEGAQWHRDLLRLMGNPAPGRGPVLAPSTAESLSDYLSFRHFFRHAYSNKLDWSHMRPLVTNLRDVWAALRTDIQAFIASSTGDPSATG